MRKQLSQFYSSALPGSVLFREKYLYGSFKSIFHLATLFARTDKKVGTLPTCSRQIISPANFNQSLCRILVFASRPTNKVAKWKIGFNQQNPYAPQHFTLDRALLKPK